MLRNTNSISLAPKHFQFFSLNNFLIYNVHTSTEEKLKKREEEETDGAEHNILLHIKLYGIIFFSYFSSTYFHMLHYFFETMKYCHACRTLIVYQLSVL